VAEDIFGPVVSVEDVIQAAVTTLRVWVPEYLADQEVKHSLQHKIIPRPPAPESYHGGVDMESWIGADAPEVMVVCKPSGTPELSNYGYTQGYDLQVGCICIGYGGLLAERAEDDARTITSYLGAASMLLVQQPTLGGLAERLVMTAAPDVTLPDSDKRAIAQVVTGFMVWVPTIIEENAGPVQPNPDESPEWKGPEEPFGEEPVVETVEITVDAEKI